MQPDLRDQIIDFVRERAAQTGLPASQLVAWIGISASKFSRCGGNITLLGSGGGNGKGGSCGIGGSKFSNSSSFVQAIVKQCQSDCNTDVEEYLSNKLVITNIVS